MGLFLLIGYLQDWAYVMKRDGKRWYETFHLFFVAFILVCMSANTLYHYFGEIREWNVLGKAEMPKVLARLQAVHPLATPDLAYDWLEKNRPGMNLWFTSRKGPNKPAGAELWLCPRHRLAGPHRSRAPSSAWAAGAGARTPRPRPWRPRASPSAYRRGRYREGQARAGA